MRLQCRDLSFGYQESRKKILHNINCGLSRPGFHSIFGPSGVGKSTFARIVASPHEQNFEGELLLEKISTILYSYNLERLPGWASAGSHLDKVVAPEKEALKQELISIFGLANLMSSRFHQLSMGQQNRINLIRYLLQDFDMLILDESLANVDEKLRQSIIVTIKRIFPEKMFLYISHHLMEVATFCDEIMVFGASSTQKKYTTVKGQNTMDEDVIDKSRRDKTMLEIMNAFRRIYQFLIVYAIGVSGLLLLKHILELSDYVIPGFPLLIEIAKDTGHDYFFDVLNTLWITVLGQIISIILAFTVGIAGRKSSWMGSFIKMTAYNIQAYPIVALAPIIFILLGDGFIPRLLIASMICYFPLLLSVLGVMSSPVKDIEHFYIVTGRMRWQLEVKIRAFENLSKLATVISGSATIAMAGAIVAEFIAADAGIGYSIRIALYQSDLAKILVALFMIGIIISVYQGLLETCSERIKKYLMIPDEH